MFESVFINPSENIRTRIPPIIMPELKNSADMPSTPRSLNACFVHLNHGEYDIANPMHMKITIGVDIPQIPAILVIFFFNYYYYLYCLNKKSQLFIFVISPLILLVLRFSA